MKKGYTYFRITRLLRRKANIILLAFVFFLLSAYPIYKNSITGGLILTYNRHIEILENRSEFYNPWQYRILSPLIVEGMKYVYDRTIDKIYPIEKHFHYTFKETSTPTPETAAFMKLINTPNFLKYLIIFLLFRFAENALIFILAYFVFACFIKSDWLIFLGLIMMSWSMGNSVMASDLSFNTYLDIIFYLITAIIILYKLTPWYLLPMAFLASLNRETSLMIPYLYFISNIKFQDFKLRNKFLGNIQLPKKKVWIISILSFAAYLTAFLLVRWYFGYRPQTEWKVPAGLPMLKLNLFSPVAIKNYFEMIGAFSIFPFLCLFKFQRCSQILRIWFIAIVPIWFLVHLFAVVAYETRLFLMPTFLIFIPMVLQIIEYSYQKNFVNVQQSARNIKV